MHKINSLFKVKIYVKTSLTLYKLTSRDFMEKEQVSLTLYKLNKEFILLKKTEPRGKSGLEQNESLRAYPYLFKTINQSQFQKDKKYKRARSGFVQNKC